ncbi:unnamed protein product [Nippostrongylus brasiliensis]|uniref:Phage protein n=1 Tax=Nippostrongylus brasiliensis TaxID=27835 RepID=A0A0N4XP08_NIPBR|nr:unnamed protein product [Nippostrongylus brasiliensis]
MPSLNKFQIASDGYWECVEITGVLGNGEGVLYYHAENTANAAVMLEHVTNFTGKSIASLTIRMDPDPLRLRNGGSTRKRIASWSKVAKSYSSQHRLVFDSDMPL